MSSWIASVHLGSLRKLASLSAFKMLALRRVKHWTVYYSYTYSLEHASQLILKTKQTKKKFRIFLLLFLIQRHTVNQAKPWTPVIFLKCNCVKKKQLQCRYEKTKPKQQHLLVCGFVASSHVLIFAVIGGTTINIPEIFQVFIVLFVWQLPHVTFFVDMHKQTSDRCIPS